MKDCNCKKPYTITSIHDVDIDDLATTPDYFIGAREIKDPSTGNDIITPVRIPGKRVMPNGNLANVIALDTNNTTLEVPENQVLGGYYDVQPGGNVMRLADSTHPAQFLMLGKYADGKMLVQTTGFLTIPAGHQYAVGYQYYLGNNGQPITGAGVTNQKLFVPLNEYVLNVNGEF